MINVRRGLTIMRHISRVKRAAAWYSPSLYVSISGHNNSVGVLSPFTRLALLILNIILRYRVFVCAVCVCERGDGHGPNFSERNGRSRDDIIFLESPNQVSSITYRYIIIKYNIYLMYGWRFNDYNTLIACCRVIFFFSMWYYIINFLFGRHYRFSKNVFSWFPNKFRSINLNADVWYDVRGRVVSCPDVAELNASTVAWAKRTIKACVW